jgi:hypothetical protein
MRRVFTVVCVLAVSLSGLVPSEVRGADKEEEMAKMAILNQLAGEYKDLKPRNSDDRWVNRRVRLVDRVGRLEFGPSVSFLQRVLKEDKSIRVHVATIVALGRTGTRQSMQLAYSTAVRDRKETLLVDALPWGLRFAKDQKGAEWLAKMGLRNRDPNVRRAVADALARMESTAGAKAHLLKALRERDVKVLYEVIRALGKTGDEATLEPILKYGENKDWRLREALAFALGGYKSPGALGKLTELVRDTDWHVQESAVHSIKRIGGKEIVPILIEALKDTHLRVAEEIRVTLEKMTGKNFGFDHELWKSWWDLKGKKDPKPKEGREVSKVVTYHGIKVLSDRVVFVIDSSGSMEAKDPSSGQSRMDLAKEELLNTLDQLTAKTRFNIVTFSASPLMFEREMLKATPANKKKASEWVQAQLPAGQTNTHDTLKKILTEIGGLDTIFFLSDGLPTAGRYLLQEKILAEISKLNQFLKVRIHCIALLVGTYGAAGAPDEDKKILEHFMERLAEENDGTFIVKK